MDGSKRKDKSPVDWQRKYRDLHQRYSRFIKRYDQIMQERQFYKHQAYNLEAELRTIRPEVYQAYRKIERLEERVENLLDQNVVLRKQLAGVKETLDVQARPVPAFVKANVPQKTKKRPGRKAGVNVG